MTAPAIILVTIALLYAAGGFFYPFRPKRFERLFYSRWQRTDTRKVEAVVMWPLGIAIGFMGAWIGYGLSSPAYQPTWPVFASFGFMVLWGGGAVTSAWIRRRPVEHSATDLEPAHRPLKRKLIVGGLTLLGLAVLASVLVARNDGSGFATNDNHEPSLRTPTVPKAGETSEMPEAQTGSLAFEHEDTQLGARGASVEHVDFAGDELTAIEEIWESEDGPMTASDRMFLGGEWRPKPDDYWRGLGREDGGVLMAGSKKLLLLDRLGNEEASLDKPNAGFPVAVLGDSIVYSVDEDDDGESGSDPDLLSEGIFATDFDGKVIWRAASDSDERLRSSVFSFYGASRTDHDTALVVVYGGFPPDDEALALYEVDPSKKQLTRLPLPKEAFGTKAVVEIGDDWLCALGSYDDGDGRHHLRAWRRDGSGDVLVTKAPALKGWIDWRVQGGSGEFVTWEDGTVRRIRPTIKAAKATDG